jgi:hypothetical protein
MSKITYELIQKFALSFEGVTESPHFEKTSFRVKKKIFLTFDPSKYQAVVKLTDEDQSLFCSHNKTIIYPVQGGWGKKGYTVIEIKSISQKLFFEIVKTAFETVKG